MVCGSIWIEVRRTWIVGARLVILGLQIAWSMVIMVLLLVRIIC